MTVATAAQTLPPHLQFDNEQVTQIEVVDDKRYRAVVFIGDVLTQEIKQAPMYRRGGRLFTGKYTLPFNFVQRCAITPLREGMVPVSIDMIHPAERKNYIQQYTIKNALINPVTGERGDVTIGKKGTMTGHLLFKKVFPQSEIAQIAYLNDGVVEVVAVNSAKDVRDAQYHYFPDWNRIVSGAVQLPSRLVQLQEFIGERMAKAMSADLKSVGEAYLQSCDQFMLWGQNYVKRQSEFIEIAKKAPGAVVATYDEISERLFVFLDITRRDAFVDDFARNAANSAAGNANVGEAISKLTDIAQLLANTQGISIGTKQPESPAETLPQHAEMTSEQLSEEMMSEHVVVETVVEDANGPVDTNEEIGLDDQDDMATQALTEEEKTQGKCSDTNAEGKPCSAKPTRRIDHKLYCNHHPKADK